MKISSLVRGKQMGQLGKIYGEYRFTLAPNEQKPMKGFFQTAVVNVIKDNIIDRWFYFIPQTIGMYLLYDWAKKANHEASKKDPSIYANDV